MYVFDIEKAVRNFREIVMNNVSIKPFKRQMITTNKDPLCVNDMLVFGLRRDIRRFYDNCLRPNTHISNIPCKGQEKCYIMSNVCNIYGKKCTQRTCMQYAMNIVEKCFTVIPVNFYWNNQNKEQALAKRIGYYASRVLKINGIWVAYNKKYYARVKREIDHDIVPCKVV